MSCIFEKIGKHVEKYEAVLLSWSLIVSSSALAQPATVATDTETASGGLQEIVVTARKRTESAQDTPVAITAISAEQLNRYDINSLEQVAATTPELQISRTPTGSGAEIALRGIGSTFSSVGIEQSVAIDVDDVYYGSGHILNEGLFDTSQIEILKGPQALLYGKNATAGAISITTADPTDTFQAMARTGYEFESENEMVEGFVSAPITDTLGIRLAIHASDMFGGFYENRGATEVLPTYDVATGTTTDHIASPADRNTPQEKQVMGRLTLKWTPTDQLTARLKLSGDGDWTNNPGWNSVPVCAGATMELSPGTPCARNFYTYANNMPADIAATFPEGGNGDLYNQYGSYSATATVDYNVPSFKITSITNFNHYHNANLSDWNGESPFTGVGGGGWGTQLPRWGAFSTELRALSNFDDPFNTMFGLYYQNTKFKYNENVMFEGVENSAAPIGERYLADTKDSYTDGQTIAAYGQLLWKIMPTLDFDAGTRFTRETKDSSFIQPYANPALNPIIYIPNVAVTANQLWHNWSPEATLTWRPESSITAYVAYKTGYKSGGFSNSSTYGEHTAPGGLAFNPETAHGFEGGVKSTWFDNQVLFNIIGYYYKYSDLQIDFWNSVQDAFVTTNAGAAKTKGVELESRWAPRALSAFSMRGTLNYNVARYSDFEGPCYTGQTAPQGCSLLGPEGALFQNLDGRPTEDAPLWTASLGANYNYPFASGHVLGLSVDTRYSAAYNFSSVDDPLAKQGGYFYMDASARLMTHDDKWEVALVGKNLTNKFYFNTEWSTTNTGSGTGSPEPRGEEADLVGFANLPRTIELQFTWRH
jgi:iron complex outermembrane receptor protein